MLSDETFSHLLDAFASSEPAPGGGSAAALAGALGTALLMMVCALPKTRSGTAAEREALGRVRARLEPMRDDLASLIETDAAAYRAVVAAYRTPNATEEEKASCRAGIDRALVAATDAPVRVAARCRDALLLAPEIVRIGNPNARSDVGVAVLLLDAGLEGAVFNVEANVRALADPGVRGRALETVHSARRETRAAKDAVLASLRAALASGGPA